MKISVEKTEIPGVLLIRNEIFEDERGFFKEIYRQDIFGEFESLGLPSKFVQLNSSFSKKNVLRGLHFQFNPPMAKLMRVSRGTAFLVAVDLRKESPSFKKWFGITLSEKDHIQMYAPEGFAWGFCAISDDAEIEYLSTSVHIQKGESGILWSDPQIGIKWPVKDPILSEKDKNQPLLKDNELLSAPNLYSFLDSCRICGSKNLVKYFDFGKMPLVDSFVKPGEKDAERLPLSVMFCNNCSNSQLSVVVDPHFLFSNYIYHSSVSRTYKEHCLQMAKDIKSLLNREKLKVLDIASNDGCLLKEFKSLGYEVIGVEPAENLSKIANEDGIRTLNSFWNAETAEKVLKDTGKVDVITATNVLAHVNDVHEFVAAAEKVLADNGIFVIEVPYMVELIKQKEFGQIFHEHLSYFLVRPLKELLSSHKMKLHNAANIDIHGGMLRIMAIKESNNSMKINKETIDKFLDEESQAGLYGIETYKKLEKEFKSLKDQFLEIINELHSQGNKIAAYGASGKGNMFVNYCGLDNDKIKFIVDDTKDKQGKLYPGTKIQIVPYEWLEKEKPDYLIILAWNFNKEIMEKTGNYGLNGGKYILIKPHPKIVQD